MSEGGSATGADETGGPTQAPKVFISYSWTSAEHQEWVVDLATRLRQAGVDAVMDAFDLKPGQDKYDFMEQMVKDPAVQFVLLVCDRAYSAKADGRKGGVGDETQIITPELYGNVANEKFIPVVSEFGEDGRPTLPAYLKSRIYIDLSSEQAYYDGFDQLLRVIHRKPAHPKPALGSRPAFLDEGATTASVTHHLLQACLHRVKEGRRPAAPVLDEYLGALVEAVGALQITHDPQRLMDDEVVDAIHAGKPYRDEFVAVVDAVALHVNSDETASVLGRFFEAGLSRSHRQEPGSWNDAVYDPVRFSLMEMFLYAVATLLERDALDALPALLNEVYVYRARGGERRKGGFGSLWSPIDSLEQQRKRRLKLDRVSLVADLLKERADRTEVSFEQIQQVELLLYLRSAFLQEKMEHWWPRTLVYASHFPQPLELFYAAKSARRFRRIQAVLDVRDVDHLVARFEASFPDEQSRHLRLGHWPIPLVPLLNLNELAPERFGNG